MGKLLTAKDVASMLNISYTQLLRRMKEEKSFEEKSFPEPALKKTNLMIWERDVIEKYIMERKNDF